MIIDKGFRSHEYSQFSNSFDVSESSCIQLYHSICRLIMGIGLKHILFATVLSVFGFYFYHLGVVYPLLNSPVRANSKNVEYIKGDEGLKGAEDNTVFEGILFFAADAYRREEVNAQMAEAHAKRRGIDTSSMNLNDFATRLSLIQGKEFASKIYAYNPMDPKVCDHRNLFHSLSFIVF